MSTFNEFIKNDDAYSDLYTPLLYQEKGMKRGKEQFRDFNRLIKQTSRKANEIGQGMQSQTDLIKQALNKFVGEMNPAAGINKIGQQINNKLDEFSCKLTGMKRLEKSQSQIQQPSQPQLTTNDKGDQKESKQGEAENLKQLHLQSTHSTPNQQNNQISLTIK